MKKISFISFFVITAFFPIFVVAGTIDPVYKYAKGLDPNVGTINFGATQGSVQVNDTTLTGYVWGDKVGWINLAPTYGGVVNDGSGVLSGYAWGELAGWINFKPTNGGVTIDGSGVFSGYAWSQNFGWILFNCATNSSCATEDFKVITTWRPAATPTPTPTPGGGGGGGGGTGTIATPTPTVTPSPTVTVTPIPTATPIPTYTPTPPIVLPTVEPSSPPPIVTATPTPPGFTPTPTPGVNATPSGPPNGSNPSPGTEPGNNNNPGNNTPGGNGSSGGAGSGGSGTSGGSSSTFLGNGPINAIYTGISSITTGISSAVKTLIGSGTSTPTIAATREKIKEVVDTPIGSATTKTITAGGIAAASALTVGSLFAGSLVFADLVLIPFRLWLLLLGLFGLRKRYRSWGTVYDSVTKQPLDPAYVTVTDRFGNQVADSITDLDGRFGFLLPPGTYTLRADKTHYVFPSAKLEGRSNDILYDDLYFGEPITVRAADELIIKNIPLDPIGFDWNEFQKNERKLMTFYSNRDVLKQRIYYWFFIFGLCVSILTLITVPEPYNYIIFGVYAFILLFRRLGLRPKKFGSITYGRENIPLSFGIVRIYSIAMDMQLIWRVCDKFGKYFMIVPPGKYIMTVESKNADESYTAIYKSEVFETKNGIINKTLRL